MLRIKNEQETLSIPIILFPEYIITIITGSVTISHTSSIIKWIIWYMDHISVCHASLQCQCYNVLAKFKNLQNVQVYCWWRYFMLSSWFCTHVQTVLVSEKQSDTHYIYIHPNTKHLTAEIYGLHGQHAELFIHS